METRKTQRGFTLGEFKDGKGIVCSIQDSSLATQAAIWFGPDNANPRRIGPDGGMIPVPLPDVTPHDVFGKPISLGDFGTQVLFHTRMHLSLDHVRLLVQEFRKFRKKRYLDVRSFTDLYGLPCSIRATQGRLELGPDDAKPQICDRGWRDLKVPEGTIFTTHMHLGMRQINDLLPTMTRFLRTGHIAV